MNSKQHCYIVPCSKSGSLLLLRRFGLPNMCLLWLVLLCRWCSRFDGALLPTSFEQTGRGEERTLPSHTHRRKNCQYYVGPPFLVHNPLVAPSMVEGSTSSSPPRASDADHGVLDGLLSARSIDSMVSLGDRPCSVDGRARVVHIICG